MKSSSTFWSSSKPIRDLDQNKRNLESRKDSKASRRSELHDISLSVLSCQCSIRLVNTTQQPVPIVTHHFTRPNYHLPISPHQTNPTTHHSSTPKMASLLFRPMLSRPHTPFLSLGVGLTAGLSLFAHHRFQAPARLDSAYSTGGGSVFSTDSYKANAKTPVLGKSGGLNPAAVRQISGGSVVGEFYSLILWEEGGRRKKGVKRGWFRGDDAWIGRARGTEDME